MIICIVLTIPILLAVLFWAWHEVAILVLAFSSFGYIQMLIDLWLG